MKTQIISAIGACLFPVMLVSNASAQEPKVRELPSVTINPTNVDVPVRAQKSFNRTFPDAEDVNWSLLNNRFMVKFNQDNMNHHAIYLKSGFQVYHIGYGFEQHLPAKIRSMVKSSYGEYTITRSFVVDQDNRNIWIVNLQSPDKYVMAGIEDGRITEIKRFDDFQSSEPVTSMIKRK
ncbi:hypothetical protein GZH53_12640 [Flavihumibacter sp. R14]|nr:hypothetical protein [Flavihumibacter soli]